MNNDKLIIIFLIIYIIHKLNKNCTENFAKYHNCNQVNSDPVEQKESNCKNNSDCFWNGRDCRDIECSDYNANNYDNYKTKCAEDTNCTLDGNECRDWKCDDFNLKKLKSENGYDCRNNCEMRKYSTVKGSCNVDTYNWKGTNYDWDYCGNEDYVEKAKKNLIKSENLRDCIDSCKMRSWSDTKTTCNVYPFIYTDPTTKKNTEYTWDYCDSTTNINCPESKCDWDGSVCKDKPK